MLIKNECNPETRDRRSIDCSIDLDNGKITFRVWNSKTGLKYAEFDNIHAAKLAYSEGWGD